MNIFLGVVVLFSLVIGLTILLANVGKNRKYPSNNERVTKAEKVFDYPRSRDEIEFAYLKPELLDRIMKDAEAYEKKQQESLSGT